MTAKVAEKLLDKYFLVWRASVWVENQSISPPTDTVRILEYLVKNGLVIPDQEEMDLIQNES